MLCTELNLALPTQPKDFNKLQPLRCVAIFTTHKSLVYLILCGKGASYVGLLSRLRLYAIYGTTDWSNTTSPLRRPGLGPGSM